MLLVVFFATQKLWQLTTRAAWTWSSTRFRWLSWWYTNDNGYQSIT
jgi:hypothetical protein